MNQPDLLRTIQLQQAEINQLRDQLSRSHNVDFQAKYKKALKEIFGIIKANRQLKEELNRLSSFKSGEGDNLNRINKEQIGKAYEKNLKEKNELLGQKEALMIQNENLKYSVSALEDTVAKLKSEKMALAREKQGISKLNALEKSHENPNDKLKDKDLKQKEAEFRKTLQNYEERQSSLSKTNRKLQQQISQLENKLYNLEAQYKNKLNEKDIEVKVSKSSAREEFQSQITSLKKEVSQLKLNNNELLLKVNSYSNSIKTQNNGANQYEQHLIEALRDLKVQMEPMSAQIAELQDKNEAEREQVQRQRANLQIKVMEYQAEIDRMRENQKILEQKLLKQTDKSRKWEEAERTIRKLEEENQMLGGRVIVLEAKEVTLRNRSGDELEERVLEFQTRVEMLLSDKQTVANTKNVGIHQMIALKAYIMELDAQLKHVVLNYEYAEKKYKSYKQKCSQLIRELKQHDIAINALKGKLQGYDRLVVKLQGELQRAITINDNEMKAINVKITESTMNSIQIYKKRYESLVEKLSLQEKYAEQEIQTLKLNYDTKILDLNLKLEQLSSIKETIGLYKSKNQELSGKLTQRQNQLLETKMTKIVIADTVPQSKNPLKDTINKLHDAINLKESTILNLENQIRKTEQQWKGKYHQLQETTTATLTKKNREDEEKKRQIESLENEIRTYRNKINELETIAAKLPASRADDEADFRKSHHFSGQISDLQVQLEDFKNRYEIECARTAKLNKANIDLKQTNNELEGECSRLKFQIKRIQKEMQLQLEDKTNEIKRIQAKSQQTYLESSRVQKPELETNSFKLNSLRMELEMLQSQAEQVQKDKVRYYNRSIELEREVSELSIKVEELNYALERTKNSISNDLLLRQTEKEQQIERLQYNLKSLKDKNSDLELQIAQYESDITKLRNELNKERQRLILENDSRDEEISKLVRELNRVRADITSKDDMRAGIEQDYEYKINRMTSDNISLRDEMNGLQNELQRYESQIKFLKDREAEYGRKAEGQQDYIIKLSNDIKELQDRQIQMDTQLVDKDGEISKLTGELTFIRSEILNITSNIESKDAYISRITSELNNAKNNLVEMEIQFSQFSTDYNKTKSELVQARSRTEDLQHQLSLATTQLNRIKSQALSHETNYNQTISTLQDKDMTIIRLQSDLKAKTQQIHDLEFQLSGKASKISQLQNESIRLRSASSDFQSELMEKNAQISRLTYDLNNIKIRYETLEHEHENNDTNWASMNRELASIRAQIGNYEDDIEMKNMTIERQKNDIKELAEQIQRINEEIFEKNKTINSLNQELFRLKIEGDERSSEQIYKLETQIYMLKSKVNNLQGELETKESELSRVRLEISTVRSNITVNRYTDQEYDMLQQQYYQAQKSLTDTRGIISEKDIEITQLEAKVEYLKKIQAETKRRFNEERNDLQTQLQNVLTRQRELRKRIGELESEAILQENRTNDEQKWGIHLYQQQCDRLQKIVQELQEQVNSLKLKMTYMTNQEDRIIENLTLMTLTFAEVEALRDRMKIKENEISQVRKSLINFATSSDEITSMGSRMVVKERTHTDKSIQKRDQPNSLEELDRNAFTYKFSQDLYNTEAGKRAETSIYGQNNYGVDLTKDVGGKIEKNVNQEFSQQIHEGNQQDEWNQHQIGPADRKLNQMMSLISEKQKQGKSNGSSQKGSQNVSQHASAIYDQNLYSQAVHQSASSLPKPQQVSQSFDQPIQQVTYQPTSNQTPIQQVPSLPQPVPQSLQQTNVSFSSQQYPGFYGQAQPPSQTSWRYGSSQGQSLSVGGSQVTTQVMQQKSAQQIKVNVAPVNIGPSKALSPPHQSFTNIPLAPGQQVQFQTLPGPQAVQGWHFGVFQQPLQYPGFAR